MKKTSWNQRALKNSSAKQTKSTSKDTGLGSSRTDASPKQTDTEISIPSQDNFVIQSNKIPHPPPQSTRPTSTPARKLRLSSAVKNNQKKQSDISENLRSGKYNFVNFILVIMVS